ncbi:DUF1178 family protein [Sinorhizobium meliloti]|uniref:DUF1178 family protein n=3 Tax=Rhizobium meliloti TaxID=382 RepID=Q92MK0_RHIME|nr:DUF1178 family protein [Sinorhizobium meliloti]PST23895.1 DUF1178 domain-containing protein [Mesorhizobium loti]TWA89030.1 hypothetical protein FB000_14329 [Ensifer sp. SEMIA 134]TWB24898.1 hypothetical protein FB001_14712 [Ensifer sp. SEMIA 135]AEG05344.1 protein of unknown function DUF1178 [Sinorhizobium meliloti BL225C]AEG54378.1 protein of unknown function DUF1178 [Sinorhizobium meliloti AK83]
MIHYNLACDKGHAFEGWFSSSDDFDRQVARRLVTCPSCGSDSVSKQLMAPAVSTARKKEARRELVMDQAQKETVAKLKELVKSIRENAEDVGERFPDEARKIHYGEADQRGLIGKATAEEAIALIEEGIEIAPLPVLPDDTN